MTRVTQKLRWISKYKNILFLHFVLKFMCFSNLKFDHQIGTSNLATIENDIDGYFCCSVFTFLVFVKLHRLHLRQNFDIFRLSFTYFHKNAKTLMFYCKKEFLNILESTVLTKINSYNFLYYGRPNCVISLIEETNIFSNKLDYRHSYFGTYWYLLVYITLSVTNFVHHWSFWKKNVWMGRPKIDKNLHNVLY